MISRLGFESGLQEIHPKTAAKAVSLDLWICHHFKVLPTEERFKRLTDIQKNQLFLSWTLLPSSEQIKAYHQKKAGDPVVSDEDEVNFKKLGYSSDQIKRMKEQLEHAGYSQQD